MSGEVSRYIAHKVRIDTSEADSMGDARILDAELSESNEVLHCREGEERRFARAVEDMVEELDEGEALVLQVVII